MRVFVVGGAIGYANWITDCEIVRTPVHADIILFTGGEDVTPKLYGCKKHPTTWNNEIRDIQELTIFEDIREDQLVIGVCRGSQFLCVANGGILVQNCDNHAVYGTHLITNGVENYEITSTHHQMAYPFCLDKSDYDILFWSKRSTLYEGDKVDSQLIDKEPEITVYHKENFPVCIGIQGHQEMIPNYPICSVLNNLIKKYGKF